MTIKPPYVAEHNPPFSLQMEPTEGCNLACSFCGIAAIRDNSNGRNSPPFRYMELATAQHVAAELRRLVWNPRVEFAMHGEPTLNRALPEMVAAFHGFHTMVTSNGAGLLQPGSIRALFEAGLGTLCLDDYRHADIVPRLRYMVPQELQGLPVTVHEYPVDLTGNPHRRHGGKRLVYIADISAATKGTHSNITNQAGNAGPLDHSRDDKRCARPFRELAVRWDGNVALCCDDWKGTYKVGNVMQMPLDRVWDSMSMNAARRMLLHEGRAAGPCKGCNVRTYRNGLLPDKMGKQSMPAPDKVSRLYFGLSLEGENYSEKLSRKGLPSSTTGCI